MKILLTTILFLVSTNSFAKEKMGTWKRINGSQEEIINKLQERVIDLDKRDDLIRKTIFNLRERIYYFECKYEKDC